MKTIFEYTQNNILIMPQALFAMQDVSLLTHNKHSAIFHKHLEQDLLDIEFYTNTPCLVYIESGHETLTDNRNHSIGLHSGSALFIPQGLTLHSDYVKNTRALKAYLVFFDQQLIQQYLSRVKRNKITPNQPAHFFTFEDTHQDLHKYFSNIKYDLTDPYYLELKLLELLHLIAANAGKDSFIPLLSYSVKSTRRNLQRLLEKQDILHLTVTDLAQLSGRSLSAFNRDFKQHYHTTPKKWLQDRRLSRAKDLLEQDQLSVTETAAEVGYENISHFIKAFKLKYGQTPKQIKVGE